MVAHNVDPTVLLDTEKEQTQGEGLAFHPGLKECQPQLALSPEKECAQAVLSPSRHGLRNQAEDSKGICLPLRASHWEQCNPWTCLVHLLTPLPATAAAGLKSLSKSETGSTTRSSLPKSINYMEEKGTRFLRGTNIWVNRRVELWPGLLPRMTGEPLPGVTILVINMFTRIVDSVSAAWFI